MSTAPDLARDGKRILTASYDKTARIWDTQGKELAVLKGHTQPVNSALFSDDGKRILTASWDKTARIWDTQGKELAVLKGHTQPVNSALFSEDGKRILTASYDNTARIWDTQGKELAVLKGHTQPVISAIFSEDGKRILTASYDNTARIWDTQGKELAVLKGHTGYVISAIFSEDGKRILTASYDNTARIWDTQGKELAVLKGHTSAVFSARFSDDGKRILTASYDNTARIWDTQGKELAVLKGHTSAVFSARFSDDGKRILTASYDNTARIWRMEELDDLLGRGCEWLNDYLVIHAEDLDNLKVCQTPKNMKAAAPYLVKAGEDKAKSGDIEDAIATFKTALKWNPQLKFAPQKKAEEFEDKGKAERLVSEASSLVREKKIKEAIAVYNQAQKLDAKVEIDFDAWGRLCRQGSLNKSAKEVMFACGNAVKLAPDSGYIRDSRGLARALTGNYQGAINDFEAFIAQTDDKESKAQREGWVKLLREGKNPFTEEELKKLRG